MATELEHQTGGNVDDPVVEDPRAAIEEKARQKGWVPEDEWKRTDKEWVDADEFLRRDSFFKKISSLKFEIQQLRDSMRVREQQHAEILEKERKQMIEELKAAKKQALREGEFEQAADLDEQLDNLREIPAVKPQSPQEPPPEFIQWVGENDWYTEYPHLRAEADALGPAIANMNPNMPFPKILDEVAKRVKMAHPEIFNSAGKQPVSKAEGAQTRKATKKTKGLSLDDLPESDRKVARTLIKNGVLTEEQYLKDYQILNG